MSHDSFNSSRRSLLKGSFATAAYLSLTGRNALAQSLPCNVGFNFQNYTINDVAVAQAPAAGENAITANHYLTSSYAQGAGAIEMRNLLTLDVGSSQITDYYVFNQANNELLFWKKLGSGEVGSSAMMVLAANQLNLKVTVVSRHASLGYFGRNLDLAAAAPVNYTTAVGTYNAALLCGGSTLLRPYTAPAATGGQGDLGILHRVNIIRVSNSEVRIHLGGDAAGAGRHGAFATNHYVMGGLLYDQSGNQLSDPGIVVYADANNQQLVFRGLDLAGDGVRVIRAVMFDTLQGRLMSFLDL